MKKTMILVALSAILALNAAPAMADTWTAPTNPGQLQTAFNTLTVGGLSSIDVSTDYISDLYDSLWMNTGSGSVATMVIELAGYKDTNVFGIYDPLGEDLPLVVFAGGNVIGASKTVTIGAGGEIWLGDIYMADGVTLRTPDREFGSEMFGFYLDSTAAAGDNDGVWYSDTAENSDQYDHMFAYRGVGDTIYLPTPTGPTQKTIGDSYFFLAWEDLNGAVNADWNYTDMVVMIESVEPVPVPGAVLLGVLGLSVAGARLRRRQS